MDPKILRPISHRTVAQQEALTLIRARNLLVRLRTAAVNAVRGLAKPCGYRLPASSTLCFPKRCVEVLPPGLVQALEPVLEQIASLTMKIKHYDRLIKKLTETEYVETQALIKVYGVGQLTALTYVLTLGSKQRFQRSQHRNYLEAPDDGAGGPCMAAVLSVEASDPRSSCLLNDAIGKSSLETALLRWSAA
jgi:transposase